MQIYKRLHAIIVPAIIILLYTMRNISVEQIYFERPNKLDKYSNLNTTRHMYRYFHKTPQYIYIYIYIRQKLTVQKTFKFVTPAHYKFREKQRNPLMQ